MANKLILAAFALVAVLAFVEVTEAGRGPPMYLAKMVACKKDTTREECDKRNSQSILAGKQDYLGKMDSWIANLPEDKKATWEKDHPRAAKTFGRINQEVRASH